MAVGGDARPQIFSSHFDDGKLEELMKQHAERDASREADKLALRLKLTPEQKEKDLMSGGSDLPRETMQTILTPEQLAVYDQRKTEELERMKGIGGPTVIRESKIESK